MIKSEHRNDSMSQWIGIKKASEIVERDRATVFRNAMAGLLEFRFKENHLYIYRPSVETFNHAPLGAPERNNSDKDYFHRRDDQNAVMAYRQSLQEKHDDVIFEMVKVGAYLAIQATIIEPDKEPKKLAPKKIKKI